MVGRRRFIWRLSELLRTGRPDSLLSCPTVYGVIKTRLQQESRNVVSDLLERLRPARALRPGEGGLAAVDGASANVARSRVLTAWLAISVLVLTVVGCSKPVPTESEIVGTWVGESPDGWGEPGGIVVFHADGTFSATAVPEAMLERGREATAMNGDGTWAIYAESVGSTLPGVRM